MHVNAKTACESVGSPAPCLTPAVCRVQSEKGESRTVGGWLEGKSYTQLQGEAEGTSWKSAMGYSLDFL